MSAWIYHFNVCCAAIWLYDMHNVTVKGFVLTVPTPNVSGIILINVANVNVHFITTFSSYDRYCLGIAIYEADSVEVRSSSANNCTHGFRLVSATNSHISDITATYNMWGVVLLDVDNSCISNTLVTHNSLEGMYLGKTNNIHIVNTTATNNRLYGMHLWYMFNTYISYTTATHNGENGMFLDTMDGVHIISTTAMHNIKKECSYAR